MLRSCLVGALVVACAAAAGAQTLGVARQPGIAVQPASPPPAEPAPPPPAHPSGGGAPLQGGDLFLAHPDTYAPHFDHRRWHRRQLRDSPYALLPFAYSVAPVYARPPRDRSGFDRDGAGAPGFLRLDVQPRTAHVYVDGFFVGSVEDMTGALRLAPGPHRIELEADGFARVTFDVQAASNDTVRFTSRMERVRTASEREEPAVAIASPSAKTLYVVPRCYAGDRPPTEADLPAGCRLADLRVVATAAK